MVRAEASERKRASGSERAEARVKHNVNLHKARNVDDDEFYTQIEDIEDELRHYTDNFKGKTVFCNCDDPEKSNFWKFFRAKFKKMKLKKLISTHYKPSTLFENSDAYMLEYDGKKEKRTGLKADGSFSSLECMKVLKRKNVVVVTNPPFSKFRDRFLPMLIQHEVEFLILGNFNATSYRDIFPLIQQGKMWLGVEPRGHTFYRPDGSKNAVNTVWYTNIKNKRFTEDFDAQKSYKNNEKKYPKYDNYDAIEVSKYRLIPKDYTKEMGVPITFLDKINPAQFEILGLSRYLAKEKGEGDFTLDGRTVYMRLVIKHKRPVK